MLGSFLQSSSLAEIDRLPFHSGICNCYSLRLAILYDAPLATQLAIIEQGEFSAGALAGTLFGAERNFLVACVYIRSGHDEACTNEAIADVQRHYRCKSC